MTAPDLPHLTEFAQAYFHQDWPEVSGPTWEAVVDHFLREATADDAADLVADLDALLTSGIGDDALLRALDRVDLNYAVDEGSVRPWLTQVRARLTNKGVA